MYADNTLNIMSSPGLHNLTTNWVTEYERLNPAINITITGIIDNQAIAGSNLSFISDEYFEAVNDKTYWKIVIGHDAIVSVINEGNPMLNEICLQGISAKKFAQLTAGVEKPNWARLINGGLNATVNFYMIDNESVKERIANFIKTDLSRVKGIKAATPVELISAVQKDPFAIGFCKLTDVRKANTNELAENIRLLPIDKNGNGRIDNFENIYDSPDAFSRGVWIGKYPAALCSSIYAVSSIKPTDKNALAFLTWVIADGGQFLNQSGYSNLAGIETKSILNSLMNNEIPSAQISNTSVLYMWVIILIALVIAGFIISVAFNIMKSESSKAHDGDFEIKPVLKENIIAAPKGLFFDKTHTWVFMEKNGIVKVGIDDFLQHITGTLSKIKMKEPGEKVRKGEKIFTIIKDGKHLDLYAPVSGIIKEQNKTLITDSSILNSSPYSEGWVYMIEPKNWVREIQFMYMGEKYIEWLRDEFTRLKDFFATSVMSNASVYAHVVLQDGGELTDNVLADLGPEVWEDFQTNFIDTSR